MTLLVLFHENIIVGFLFLVANAIDMELGTINGFNPSSLISINTTIPQSIPKLTTFRRLEVTVELDVCIVIELKC